MPQTFSNKSYAVLTHACKRTSGPVKNREALFLSVLAPETVCPCNNTQKDGYLLYVLMKKVIAPRGTGSPRLSGQGTRRFSNAMSH
jgi:hypothetical protein